MKRKMLWELGGVLVLVIVAGVVGALIGGNGTISTSAPTPSPSAQPNTSKATCMRFREVSAGAFGELITRLEVKAGLETVGVLGLTARDPSISKLAVRAAEEVNTRALIKGEPDKTLDALAHACNKAFPIQEYSE